MEYIGQTRGWFYMLHILSTALFDRPAFRNVISHGIVLGSDGQKMSKSLRNYPDVSEVLDRDGSDAMRWFLMSSPILRGGNLVVTEQGIRDGVRQVILPLWNVYSFFTLYTNAARGGEGYDAKLRRRLADTLDQYLLANTGELVRNMTDQLDNYDISGACDTAQLPGHAHQLVRPPQPPALLRRERERGFDALYTALETVSRVAASLLPLVSEEIWRGLTGGRSVHLADWPDRRTFPPTTRWWRRWTACSRSAPPARLRKAANLRVRLPLRNSLVVPRPDALEGFRAVVADELNIAPPPARRRPPARRSSASSRSSWSTPGLPARAWAGTSSRPSRAPSPATGRFPTPAWSPPAAWSWSAGVHPGDRRGRRRAPAAVLPRCCPAAASWCSTPRSPRNWKPKAWPATWSAPSSRPARMPG